MPKRPWRLAAVTAVGSTATRARAAPNVTRENSAPPSVGRWEKSLKSAPLARSHLRPLPAAPVTSRTRTMRRREGKRKLKRGGRNSPLSSF